MIKRCVFYKRLLSRHIDGDLNSTEAAALEEHLKQCPSCRAREHRYTLLKKEIKDLHTITDLSPVRNLSPMPQENVPRHVAWKRPLGWVPAAAVIFVIGFLLFIRSDPMKELAEKNPIVYEPMRALISVMDENGQGQQPESPESYNPMRHYIAQVESGSQINRFFLYEGTVADIISKQ